MRPPETQDLLDYENYVRSKECDYCLDWNGNDPYDHRETWKTWEVWPAINRMKELEDMAIIKSVMKTLGIDK